MENDLRSLIQIIKTGSRAEVKEAQKQVAKFWYEFYIPHREEGRKVFEAFLEEIKKIEEIKDVEHQAYLINTLKWPLYAIGEEYFEQWAEFILKYIQHPSGKIRQAIIKTADYLSINIVIDLRFEGKDEKKLSPELKERVEKNKIRFGFLVWTVEKLLEKYNEPKYKRCKYVSSLPTGVYKSLQKLITESLLRSEYYENLYNEFLAKISNSHYQLVHQLTKEKILKKRREIEQEFMDFFKENKGDFGLENIKEIIYNEDGQNSLSDIIAMFDTGKSLIELNNILKTVNNAWNYFPHKILGGLSPAEKLLEYQKK